MARVAPQEYLECGEQDHKQASALSPAQCIERLGKIDGETEKFNSPGIGQSCWPPMVSWKLLKLQIPRKLLCPIGELPVKDATLKPSPLPDSKIGILNGQFRQVGDRARRVGTVLLREFAE